MKKRRKRQARKARRKERKKEERGDDGSHGPTSMCAAIEASSPVPLVHRCAQETSKTPKIKRNKKTRRRRRRHEPSNTRAEQTLVDDGWDAGRPREERVEKTK